MKFLVTAIGSLSAECVISSLRAFEGARVVGTNTLPAAWVTASRMVDTFHQVASARSPDAFVEDLIAISRAESITHILPLTDLEVDALSARRDAFKAHGITLCLPPHASVVLCRDKLALHDVFEGDALVSTIPTWAMDSAPQAPDRFPLIAKPRTGRSSEGMLRLEDVQDLQHRRRKADAPGYVVQPWLEGTVGVVDLVRQRATGRVASMGRLERTRTSNGAGLTVEMLHDGRLDAIARRVADVLDVDGCINMEFLIHEGTPRLMDVNPRFSAGVAFSRLGGYDMVVNHVRCFLDIPIDDPVLPPAAIHSRRYVEVTMATSHE